MEIKKMSESGLKFLIKEEGMKLSPYKDSVGVATIGVGCTYYENGKKVEMSDKPISEFRAQELFRNLLDHYELTVYSSTRDDINQNQFDALVSLCFNIGPSAFKKSTLLSKVNKNPNDPSIGLAFEMWKNAGGKPILLQRRKREYKLYSTK